MNYDETEIAKAVREAESDKGKITLGEPKLIFGNGKSFHEPGKILLERNMSANILNTVNIFS